MNSYVFKAIDVMGQQARGELDAENKQSVADQLKAKGLVVLDIADKRKSREIELPGANRIKLGDLAIMSRQLATMVSSGMTILRALYVLEAQTENKKLSEQLVLVRKDVEAGLPLSDALERHPKTFNPLYVAMTRAGETGGVLEDSLLRISDQLEKEESLRRQVKAAMAYPSVILAFAGIVMLAMVAFIVPVFAGVFLQFGGAGAKLPAMTRVVMGISDLVTGKWYLLLAGTALVIFAFIKWKKTPKGRSIWQRFLLRLPFKIGDIFQKVALARWSRTFSALMGAGVPLLQAIDITAQTAGNIVVEEAMANVTDSVKAGGTIAQPLMDSPVFPSMVAHMVKVGEETGALTTMLTKIGDFYEDQVAAAVKALTSILEPVMIVLVGGIVGFIVISMYLPLFSVYDQIK